MIPFEIPDRFLVLVAKGVVLRIGTTLRDRSTGRIVAHLQETRLWQEAISSVLGSGGNPASLLLSAANLGPRPGPTSSCSRSSICCPLSAC
jgi:hypothetical protein